MVCMPDISGVCLVACSSAHHAALNLEQIHPGVQTAVSLRLTGARTENLSLKNAATRQQKIPSKDSRHFCEAFIIVGI
jgi:hypothetical protein